MNKQQDSARANVTEAAELIRLAREAGCIVKLEGNWATFSPPVPPHLLLRAMDLGDEIAGLLRAEATL